MGKILYIEGTSGISEDMFVEALLDLGADQKAMMKVLNSLPVRKYCDDHDRLLLADILDLLDQGCMTDRARIIAEKICRILAEAEAKVQSVPLKTVSFCGEDVTEALLKVISAAVCIDNLDITDVIVPGLCEGTGPIIYQHGIVPVPEPVVANILQACQLPLKMIPVEGELVTPSGAAIAAALKTSCTLPAGFTIEKIGVGAGRCKDSAPGQMRLMLIRDNQSTNKDIICQLESNIDDCSGEMLGYVMEQLMKAGARDVHYVPAFMKKNRPAYLLRVLCREEDVEVLENIIFRETTTIGIRKTVMERSILPREIREVETKYGWAKVKVCTLPDGEVRRYPEYACAAKLAEEHHVSLTEAMDAIRSAYETI